MGVRVEAGDAEVTETDQGVEGGEDGAAAGVPRTPVRSDWTAHAMLHWFKTDIVPHCAPLQSISMASRIHGNQTVGVVEHLGWVRGSGGRSRDPPALDPVQGGRC